MVINLITVIVILASLATAFLSSIFGMLGGLILMGILVSLMKVGQAMILHGLINDFLAIEHGLIESISTGKS